MTISREDAEEYSQSLAQIGEGWVRQVAWAFRQGVHEALGMSRKEWRERYYGHLKIGDIGERRESVRELKSEGLSNREIADVLGVDERTVRNDLSSAELSASSAENSAQDSTEVQKQEVDESSTEPSAENSAPNDPVLIDEMDHPEHSDEGDDMPLEPLAPGWHELGPHRLYCGDSTDQEFIEACRGAAFAFADPPYNVGKADWDHGFTWQHDYLAEIASIVAVTPGNASLRDFHKVTTMPYQWSLAVEITNGMTRGALGFANWIYVALFSSGSLYRNTKDVLRVPAHTADDEGGTHPTRKPFRMMTDLIGLFTSKGDTVVDPFLGSGTTLVAADRLGRVCIGAEIDPMYCAEIVARYRKAHLR